MALTNRKPAAPVRKTEPLLLPARTQKSSYQFAPVQKKNDIVDQEDQKIGGGFESFEAI
jgi:hypothetical protein